MKYSFLVGVLMIGGAVFGQSGKQNEVRDHRPERVVFTDAIIHINSTDTIHGSIYVEDGRIVKVSSGNYNGDEFRVQSVHGNHIYPGFVETVAQYGLEDSPRYNNDGNGPQYQSGREGAYSWNDAIRTDYISSENFVANESEARAFAEQGIGVILTHRRDGLIRGTGSVVSTTTAMRRNGIIAADVSNHMSFRKGSSSQSYPNSIMGAVALIRQHHYDAVYYADGGYEMYNVSFDRYNQQLSLPVFFETRNKLRLLLADEILDELDRTGIIVGSGDEYQRIDAIRQAGRPIVIPLDFPDAYDVGSPIAAMEVSYADLKHWEMAPFNPRILHEAGVEFAFTTSRGDNFLRDLRYAVAYGLPERIALEAVTTIPAGWLNIQDEVGTLEPGKRAIFNVFSNNIFQSGSELLFQFSEGSIYEFEKEKPSLPHGTYRFNSELISGELEWLEKSTQFKINDTTSLDVSLQWKDGLLAMTIQPSDSVFYSASGWSTAYGFGGIIRDERGMDYDFELSEVELFEAKPDSVTVEEYVRSNIPSYRYPFVGFGREQRPESESVLIRNATLWTNTDQGVIVGDIRFANGKIVEIGENLSNQKGERVIDGTGKHVTPGIIDEHSHIALSGVNEGSMNSSAEVRMCDAVDSEDINIYRQLSGGVVAAQLLHGSANPIGGQSAIVKFKWGAPPSEMLIADADPFIKFALGENVKQSNWGDDYTTRFPQTRMGVEQVFRDAFTRAVAYREAWDTYNQLSAREKRNTVPPRKDLELESLAQIVYGERFISCHSYVQSEINMLMKVAEDFGFVVNTFTHILEGYKVAHIMAEHGAGGSTFSDWWAYKYEVRDAIPYNAAAMHDKGVVVAINSDDAEMGRRLNQEAAKSVKYGGMSPEDVVKMITLNPAKLLHLDDQMGTLAEGMSADIVLWSADPLSVTTKAEITWIEGTPYFDRDEDMRMREELRLEKARLIQAMLLAKDNGQPVQPVYKRDPHLWHCDDLTEIYR